MMPGRDSGPWIPDDEIVAEPIPREPRLVVLYERHIGIGVRWLRDDGMPYPLHLSLALPFVTFEIGLGRYRASYPTVTKGSPP